MHKYSVLQYGHLLDSFLISSEQDLQKQYLQGINILFALLIQQILHISSFNFISFFLLIFAKIFLI